VSVFPVESLAQQLAWLLLGAAAVGMLAYWLRIPYAIALVLVGLLVEESHLVQVPRLDPAVVLFLFLPPLLFDAAFRIDADRLRHRLRPVLVLAVPGTLLTALVVGLVLAVALQLPLAVAVLFGSVVAATDPVAVVGVFRRLGAPHTLEIVAEGESLVNDGMAITLYTTLIGIALTGTVHWVGALELFGREVLGGVAIGAALGLGFSRLTALVDDHLVEMTLSTALAYGSYLAAQSLHASGPLACVAAGLIHGSYGRSIGMSEESRRLLDDLWEYLGFLANGVLFLLVGFSVNVASLLTHAGPVAAAVVAVLVARAVVIGPLGLSVGPWRPPLSRPERLVLFWGGLRGALTLALALALPADVPAYDVLVAMAFGVVLFTLVVQGLTLAPLLHALGLAAPRPIGTG
jgi:monovalent cation:H+ antiporter, CPA1 family